MKLDLKEMNNRLEEALSNISPEDMDKFFPIDTKPKGWVSIEEHLPMMFAIDIMQGYSVYKVRDKNGNEFESSVADHDVWYYRAKEQEITHWYNK